MRSALPASALLPTPSTPAWRRLVLAACLAPVYVGLAACAVSDPSGKPGRWTWLEPYRLEVVQGNVVTKEMAEQLQPGITRDQVRALLGSPLLTDIFHANRWDYVFSIKRQGAEPQQRQLTVYFEGDRMTQFEAGALPSEREFVASIDTSKRWGSVPRLELTDAELRAIPLPTVRPSSARAAASGPARSYPPLEPAAR